MTGLLAEAQHIFKRNYIAIYGRSYFDIFYACAGSGATGHRILDYSDFYNYHNSVSSKDEVTLGYYTSDPIPFWGTTIVSINGIPILL